MASSQKRYRGVDLVARRKAFGEIYIWLYRRHDHLLRDLTANTPGIWSVAAADMERDGVRSSSGRSPTRDAVRKAWLSVAQHYPEDTERYEAVIKANTRPAISRHKGWVPTCVDPPKPPAARDATQSTRMPGPPPPSVAAASPALKAATAAGVDNGAVPLGHPDHPLGLLTALEIVELEEYPGASVEILREVLTTYREIRHIDRFSRPGWQ